MGFGALSASIPTTPALRNPLQSPAIVSDEDFPALAPISAPKAASKLPTPVGTKKKAKTKVGPEPSSEVEATESIEEKETEEEEEEEEEEEKSPPEIVWGKQKPSLPQMDTSESIIQTPVESSAPTTASKKQGLRMMRILSKDSAASSSVASPTLNTPVKSVISATESLLQFSDTASVCTGTTESRPVTPAPQAEPSSVVKKKFGMPIIGPESADMPLVVVKSKSALKKERIAAQKEKERREAEEAAAAKARDVHAPISARMTKKKEKKAAANKKGGDNNNNNNGSFKDHDDTASERPEDTASITSRNDSNKDDDRKSAGALEEFSEREENQQQKPSINYTPAQLVAEIGAEECIDWKECEMFKPLSGLKGGEYHISAEDVAKIRASLPQASASPASTTTEATPKQPSIQLTPGSSPSSVHLSLRGGGSFETRMLVTPQGSVLRGLTPQQEKRYIEIEQRRSNERTWERWGAASPPGINDLPITTSSSYPVEKTADWKAAVTAHTMAAGLAAAGNVARNMHLGTEEATRLSTKEALDYLWNTVMPALPGYAQEHLEGLAHSMAMSGCKVSVGFEGGSGEHNGSGDHEPTVTVDVKLESPGIKGMPKLEGVGIKELEKLVHQARKETEALEKKVEKLIKRNRKIVGLF